MYNTPEQESSCPLYVLAMSCLCAASLITGTDILFHAVCIVNRSAFNILAVLHALRRYHCTMKPGIRMPQIQCSTNAISVQHLLSIYADTKGNQSQDTIMLFITSERMGHLAEPFSQKSFRRATLTEVTPQGYAHISHSTELHSQNFANRAMLTEVIPQGNAHRSHSTELRSQKSFHRATFTEVIP